MKDMKITILKKNRVYFKCVSDSGFEYKLRVNELSKDLEPGTHDLLVNDVSVRSKYGTDVIYEIAMTKKESLCTLRHFRFNTRLVEDCKSLGGKWDAEEKAWVFNAIVEDEVEQLDELFNSELVSVEIAFTEKHYHDKEAVFMFGYEIAKATGRDSFAKISEGISFIEGKPDSGGSMKNWITKIPAGCVIRMQIPVLVFEKYKENYTDFCTMKII